MPLAHASRVRRLVSQSLQRSPRSEDQKNLTSRRLEAADSACFVVLQAFMKKLRLSHALECEFRSDLSRVLLSFRESEDSSRKELKSNGFSFLA